jgi:hypothetical protein
MLLSGAVFAAVSGGWLAVLVFAAGHANTLIKRGMLAWNGTVISTLDHHYLHRTSSDVSSEICLHLAPRAQ